jgi:hypothetical protein
LSGAPDLSAVLFTVDTLEPLLPLLRALTQQTAASRMEVVLVSPAGEGLEVRPDLLAPFHSWTRVTCAPPPVHGGGARARGARAAAAPVVAFCEDHSFPEPGWAEALIQRHQEGWVAVAPEIVCGNADHPGSWAMLSMTFGPYVDPVEAGETNALPWHNTSYKKEALLAQGESLDLLLEAEGILQERLRARGGRLFLERAARTRHANVSRLSSFSPDCYWGGRLYGAVRSADWRWFRRLFYAAASPAIWLKRAHGSLRHAFRIEGGGRVPGRYIPVIVACEAVAAMGEAVSYVTGMGRAAERKGEMEVHRYRHMASNDPARVTLFSMPPGAD